jgi:hypothetical protein
MRSESKKTNNRFSGYRADHYRVQLRPEKITDHQIRYADAVIEIQVASVLMHAWSEVEHDLIYKPYSGDLSPEELSILDGINGIVLCGEVFLERLQAASEARVSIGTHKFTNHYELASFLHRTLQASMGTPDLSQLAFGRVGILFKLIQVAGLDSPGTLTPFIEPFDQPIDGRFLAEKVIRTVLARRPGLMKEYLETLESNPHLDRTFLEGPNVASVEDTLKFLKNAEAFDELLREPDIHNSLLANRAPGRPQYKENVVTAYQQIRNNLLREATLPSSGILKIVSNDFESLIPELQARRTQGRSSNQ